MRLADDMGYHQRIDQDGADYDDDTTNRKSNFRFGNGQRIRRICADELSHGLIRRCKGKLQLPFHARLRIRMLAVSRRGSKLDNFTHFSRGPFHRLQLLAIFLAFIGIAIIDTNDDLFRPLLAMRNDHSHDTTILAWFDG